MEALADTAQRSSSDEAEKGTGPHGRASGVAASGKRIGMRRSTSPNDEGRSGSGGAPIPPPMPMRLCQSIAEHERCVVLRLAS